MGIRFYNNEQKIYTRLGNSYVVQHGIGKNDGHYYVALLLNNKRVTAWRRVTLTFINQYFKERRNDSNRINRVL